MKKIIRVLLIIVTVIIAAVAGIATYIKTALPNVGKPQDIKVSITPERLERGKYLANHVVVCMDCHSKRDKNLFAGPVKEGSFGGGGEVFDETVGFPGKIYSKNITPYALSNWTDGEIFRVITTGVSKDGKAMFPVMPYHSYGTLDTADVYAIIAYIRSLPAIKNDVPERSLQFPMNIIVNTIPEEAHPQTKPDTSSIIAYGKYIVTAAACAECHSKFEKGAFVKGTELGGGRSFQLTSGLLTSSNITPDKETGIGNWTKEQFVQRFTMYADSSYHPNTIGKNDFNTIMPWLMYANMKKADIEAMYAYLQTVKPIKNNVNKFIPAAN